MILTKRLVQEKPTMKFNETGAYLFRNELSHQNGYYAVDQMEFDKQHTALKGKKMQEVYVTLYELELTDDKISLKYDTAGNLIPLGKRQLVEMEMLTIDEECNVEL